MFQYESVMCSSCLCLLVNIAPTLGKHKISDQKFEPYQNWNNRLRRKPFVDHIDLNQRNTDNEERNCILFQCERGSWRRSRGASEAAGRAGNELVILIYDWTIPSICRLYDEQMLFLDTQEEKWCCHNLTDPDQSSQLVDSTSREFTCQWVER